MSTQHTVNVEKNADTLLETIGRLFARNQSLQKGHATLTRRVHDLEAELAAERARTVTVMDQWGLRVIDRDGKCKLRMGALEAPEKSSKHPNCRCTEAPLSERAVDAIIADVLKDDAGNMDELKPITAADVQLQDDIKAVHKRIHALEMRMPSAEDLGSAIHETVERMLQPGGILYRGLK